jgi:two-component system invasion response regulator UvrY
MGKVSIIIVDDHTLLRDTWALVLNTHPHFKVVASTGSGEEALELCRQHMPNIVLMDINLPRMNGVEATKQILKISPKTRVIGVSLHNQPAYAKRMMSAGASGYITKNSTRKEMLFGIKEVSEGKKYVCEEIKNILSEKMLAGENDKGLEVLSAREKDIIKFLVKGLSSKEVAEAMDISSKTVEVHRYHILKKLNLKNTAALVNYVNTHSML